MPEVIVDIFCSFKAKDSMNIKAILTVYLELLKTIEKIFKVLGS